MQKYEVTARSNALPDTVYALLLDGRSWPAWMGVDEVDVEPSGSVDIPTSELSKIGETRLIRTGRYVSREQIVTLIPNQEFGYIVLDGMLRDYKGKVSLAPLPKGGTEIRWSGVFWMPIPLAGWLMKLYLTRFMQRGVDKLARFAEKVQAERHADA